jgi:hypothetical protein
MKENTHNSIYIEIYNFKNQDVTIIQDVLVVKGYVFKNNLNVF